MPLICRQGDPLTTGHDNCDTTSTLDTPGQSTVYVEGKLIARKGDSTVSHNHQTGTDGEGDPICSPHTATITGSSSTVYVGGALVARVGDAVDDGTLTAGAEKVYCG
tara:strand:+ start:440 stop:760 length:321 start_codon:yes stop_codon:yes gene_type:complete